jgi:hypothetical protein
MPARKNARPSKVFQGSFHSLRKHKRNTSDHKAKVGMDAENVAVQALFFLAADEARLGRFLAATGIGPGEIREAAREPRFLAGVLDHLMDDESVMLAFSQEMSIPPEQVSRARDMLSGPPIERDIP